MMKNFMEFFMIILIIISKFSNGEGTMRSKIVPINEDEEQMMRQSQNTFVQWVQSLLPQRPTYDVSNIRTTTTTTTTTTKTTSSTTTTIPSKSTQAIEEEEGKTTSTPISIMETTLNAETMQNTIKSTIKPFVTMTTTTPTPTPTSEISVTSATSATTTSIISTTSTTPITSTVPVSSSTAEPIILSPPRNCTECLCGLANIQKRIVGGQETEVNQYPWMSMLLYGGRFYCAGALINDQYVITASHCVYGFRRERITVRLLEHDRKLSSIHKIDRKIAQIITHPKYNARTYDNDIAIVKLQEPVELTDVLRPVCLPTPGKSFKGELGIVTGWGALKVGGPTSNTLQEVHVPIMSQEDCRQSRYGSSRITDNMLCAGFDEGKKDSCQGDSGGPLHIVSPGTREHQLAGVVSWGEGCAKAGYPGVYARVNRYGTWIKSMTKNACICISEAKKIKKSF